jgi:hypothetical protein
LRLQDVKLKAGGAHSADAGVFPAAAAEAFGGEAASVQASNIFGATAGSGLGAASAASGGFGAASAARSAPPPAFDFGAAQASPLAFNFGGALLSSRLTTADGARLHANAPLLFVRHSDYAYPLSCANLKPVTFLQTNSGSPPAHVRWASGHTYWVNWEDLRHTSFAAEPNSFTAKPKAALRSNLALNLSAHEVPAEVASGAAPAAGAFGAPEPFGASAAHVSVSPSPLPPHR